MPDELKSERIQLFMTPSEVEAIDDWGFSNRIRGRSEAIRRLIEIGLRAAAEAQPERPSGKTASKPRRRKPAGGA